MRVDSGVSVGRAPLSQRPVLGRQPCPAVADLRRVAVQLAAAVLVAFAVSLLVQKIVKTAQLPDPSRSSVAAAWQAVVVAALVTMLVVLAVGSRPGARRVAAHVGAWVGVSTLGTVALALPLAGTRLYLGGLGFDQQFRTQYVTRLAASPHLADFNYADLPPFYPATWFWLAGRFADLRGIPGWAAYKPFAIATVAVAAVAAMVLWGLLVRFRAALLLGLVTAAAGMQATAVLHMNAGVIEPYAWLLAALMPPVIGVAWHAMHCDRSRVHRHWPHIVFVGLYVGLCLNVYTLYAGFAALTLVASAVAAVATARERAAAARTALLRLVIMGTVALCCALPVWLPYLWAAIPAGWPPTLASDFLVPVTASLPAPMVQPLALGVLCLLGTVWIPFAWRRNPVATPLGVMALAVYGWYGLSTLRLLNGTTLLAQRMATPLVVALGCGSVFAARDALRAVQARGGRNVRGAHRIVAVLGIVALVSAIQPGDQGLSAQIDAAYTAYYPSGVTAQGKRDPAKPGAWVGKVAATVDELTRTSPGMTVVLSDLPALLAYFPYSGFQTTQAVYANPLAHYEKRNAAAARWSHAGTPQRLLDELDGAPFPAPSVFVLTREPDGLQVTLHADGFPRIKNRPPRQVVFPPELFDTDHWKVRNVGPFTVAVRR